MNVQVDKEQFVKALQEIGIDAKTFEGQKLSFKGFCELYEISDDIVIEAIDRDLVSAHYDFKNDTIWIDALEAAHFYYCLRSKVAMYENPL